MNNEKEVTYDQLIRSAGEFGKYQLILFFCIFPFNVFGVFTYFIQIFMTDVAPQHWCWIPELVNLTTAQRRNLAIPLDENSPYGYSRCLSYQANWTEVLTSGIGPDQTWNTVPCQNGWEFNRTGFAYPTLSSELGWVCDKDSYQATAQSLFFVGSVFGGFLIGWIGDKFGRLPAAVLSNMIGAVAGIASAFTQNFIQLAICRLLMGMSYDNCMIMMYLIILEYISPKYRTVTTNLSSALVLTLATVALPWIALVCGDWKTLSLATSVPMALAILVSLTVPESPRWLLSKGRVDDAVNKVEKIARVNKKDVPPEMIEKFKRSISKNEEESGNIVDLLRNPILRNTFLCACIEHMCIMAVYDASIRLIGQFEFDFFVCFSVISTTELPSLVILSFTLDCTGRKLMLISTMVLSAVLHFVTPCFGGGPASFICAVLARLAVNMAVNAYLQWVPEMLPTSVRGSGISIINICGSLATIMSSFIVYLGAYMRGLPMLVIGCIAILSALISIVLPETARKEMPQTFNEAEELIKKQSVFSTLLFQKRKSVYGMNHQGYENQSFELN